MNSVHAAVFIGLFWRYFDENVIVSGTAQAHIHRDNASLPCLIAVHVTPSEAPLLYISPSANLHLIMAICVEN